MSTWWHDLSDDELRVRLLNRGASPDLAAMLVTDRDVDRAREIIATWLER